MTQTGGNQFSINTDLTNTIAELKEQIATKCGLPKENVRLVCAGRIWQDVATIGSYEPREDAIVHCLNNPPRTVSPATEQTLSVVNPMQAMLGSSASPQPTAEGDPYSQMMAHSQQMMAQNPEMMQQIMESPMVQQMMSNPEMMRSMMRMNPQMNQLMEQRPEIARLMEDPEVIQQSMQMLRNPSLMREMQRNQDLALGHLDVMPGGHDALLRAHEDVLDPLMSALTSSNQNAPNSVVDLDAYSRQTEGTPNNEALPNPWGASRAATTAAPQTATPSAAAPFAAPPVQSGMTAAAGAQSQNSNPMAPMMQQMMNNPAMMQQAMQMAGQMFGGGSQAGGSGATALSQPPQAMMPSGAPATPDPSAAMRQQMMQQLMSNPAMMQQSTQMANQMFGQHGMLAPNPTNPSPLTQTATNPFASMMEQLTNNPAMMQQSMQMAQTMFGNQAGGASSLPGLFGTPAMSPTTPDPAAGAQGPNMSLAPDAGVDTLARVRFAAQLAQLTAMGFCNEAACLRALQQHMGRVDAAIDTLLANGEGSA